MITSLGSQVTTLELLVSAGTLASIIGAAGLFMAKLGRALGVAATKFEMGIQSLTESLNRVSKSVDDGFTAVHTRMDRGEKKMENHNSRLIRLEIHNGIEPDLREG